MGKMFRYTPKKKSGMEAKSNLMAKDAPPKYEGSEHVKYKNPGFSKHEIGIPKDEPHMKSRVGKEEMHEMEDNYHMDVPDQTEDALPAKIKRARMKMDDPDQEDPKPIMGNLIREVPAKGVEDTSGEEMESPNDMQSGSKMPKEQRKKMIASVVRRKMKKNRDPGAGQNDTDNLVKKSY